MDPILFTAAVSIKTICCIPLVAAPRLQSEPALNKQTENLIVLLIYGQCAWEINCALTHGDNQLVENPQEQNEASSLFPIWKFMFDIIPDCDSNNKDTLETSEWRYHFCIFSLYHFLLCGRRSHSITFGAAVRDPCTAPSAWREAASPCHSSPVRSVYDRWKERARYSSCTQTFRR